MIPADLASTLRAVIPEQKPAQPQPTQPVAPASRVADVLSNLVPGQRVLAEVQAMLPNGSYRALVAQREVTLSLPFAAKAGDSLELEVTETNGKLTLAFVTNRGEAQAKDPSVPTTFSNTGKLIGDLMKGVDGEGGRRPPPAALNGNQALLEQGPKSGADFAPLLKQALTQSGMFYEAHQARWVAGKLPTEALRQEPQGQLPAPAQGQNPQQASTAAQSGREASAQQAPQPQQNAQPAAQTTAQAGIPREITPLVQQQLDGLANQNYAWQGQVWPGQQMWWEIVEQNENASPNDNGEQKHWRTRLKLALPRLGGVDAQIHLHPDGSIALRIEADSDFGENHLRQAIPGLQSQMEAAGLKIQHVLIEHAPTEFE